MKRLSLCAAIILQLVVFSLEAPCVQKATESAQWPSPVKGVIAVNPGASILYYAEEKTITTLDASLTSLGNSVTLQTDDLIQNMTYKNNRLYVAMGSDGIRVLQTDSQGTLEATPMGTYDPGAAYVDGDEKTRHNDIFAFSIFVSDALVYVADTLYGIRVLAFSEHDTGYSFQERGFYRKTEFSEGFLKIGVIELAASGKQYACALDTFFGVILFDISTSDPDAEIILDETRGLLAADFSYDNYARAKDVFVKDDGTVLVPHIDYVEVTPGNAAIESRLGIYTIEDQAGGPVFSEKTIVSISGGYATAMDMADKYAYVADSIGLQIVDAADPASAAVVGVFPKRSEGTDATDIALGVHAVHYMNDSAYLGVYSNTPGNGLFKGIKKLDVTSPASPVEIAEYRKKIDITGICLSNEKREDDALVRYLFAADSGQDGGLRTFRLSDSNSLANMATIDFLAVYDQAGPINDVAISGNYLYLITSAGTLEVWDVSNPGVSLDRLTSFPSDLLSDGRRLYVIGTDLYVAGGEKGLVILDISIPDAPAIRGSTDTQGTAMDVWVEMTEGGGPTYAYLADGENGLVIMDVTDTRAPAISGGVDTSGNSCGITGGSGYVYVGDGDRGLIVVDVSNRSAPVIKGEYNTLGEARGVTLSDNMVYVADGVEGIAAIDVSIPDKLEKADFSSYQTYGVARDVILSEKIVNMENDRQFARYMCVADGADGVVLVRLYENGVERESGDIDSDVHRCFIGEAGQIGKKGGAISPWIMAWFFIVGMGVFLSRQRPGRPF